MAVTSKSGRRQLASRPSRDQRLIRDMKLELKETRLVFVGENAKSERDAYQAGQERMIEFVERRLSST